MTPGWNRAAWNSVSRQSSPIRRSTGPWSTWLRWKEMYSGSTFWRSTMAVRTIEVGEKVMAMNNELAAVVRHRLAEAGVVAFNLVSSPGSGKTTLLERTLDELGEELGIAVVTGDVQTQNDADRLARRTTRLVQAVVTGGACHLD